MDSPTNAETLMQILAPEIRKSLGHAHAAAKAAPHHSEQGAHETHTERMTDDQAHDEV